MHGALRPGGRTSEPAGVCRLAIYLFVKASDSPEKRFPLLGMML